MTRPPFQTQLKVKVKRQILKRKAPDAPLPCGCQHKEIREKGSCRRCPLQALDSERDCWCAACMFFTESMGCARNRCPWPGGVPDVDRQIRERVGMPERSDEPVTVWRGEFPCRVLDEEVRR